MPRGGPWIRPGVGYEVTLSNGTTIKGADIDSNIVWWLTHDMPE
jgi:hypothetical protein